MLKFAFYVVTIEILFTGHNKERQFGRGCLETEGKMKCQRN